jgi:hypothetical protein
MSLLCFLLLLLIAAVRGAVGQAFVGYSWATPPAAG